VLYDFKCKLFRFEALYHLQFWQKVNDIYPALFSRIILVDIVLFERE